MRIRTQKRVDELGGALDPLAAFSKVTEPHPEASAAVTIARAQMVCKSHSRTWRIARLGGDSKHWSVKNGVLTDH